MRGGGGKLDEMVEWRMFHCNALWSDNVVVIVVVIVVV